MDRSTGVLLLLIGGGVAAVELVRRERIEAGQREPFIGTAEIARRLNARRGRFGSAVTPARGERHADGHDRRSIFDESFFGGFFGPPVMGTFTRVLPLDSPVLLLGGGDGGMGVDPTTPATLGPANTAPQDFTIAQFGAARVSGESPSVRAVTSAFGGNIPGVIAAIINTIIDAIAGRRVSAPLAPGLPSTGGAIVTGLRIILGRVAGIPGGGIPGPVAGGIPATMVNLSLALGKLGVDAAARARAAADPTFQGKLELEISRQRADPQRFFDVLAEPRAPRFADEPVIQFTPPPSEATAAPPGFSGETSLGLAPSPQGETSLGLSPTPTGLEAVEGVSFQIGYDPANPTPTAEPEGVTATVSADPSTAGPSSSPPSPDPSEGQTGGTVGEGGGPSSGGDAGDTSGAPGSGF